MLRSAVAIGAVVAFLSLAISCGEGGESLAPTGKLQVAAELNDPSVVIHARPDQRVVVGSIPICAIDGSVSIESVESMGGNLLVEEAAVRESPYRNGGSMLGTARATLAELNVAPLRELDPGNCDGPSDEYELLLQFTGKTDANASGFEVQYGGGDSQHSIEVPVAVTVCFSHTTSYCKQSAEELDYQYS